VTQKRATSSPSRPPLPTTPGDITRLSTLHTINKGAHHQALNLALTSLAHGDVLLFLEEGVTTLVTGSQGAARLELVAQENQIFCLQEDAQARALLDLLPDWVTLIDYDGFVALTEQHSRTLSWF